MTSPVDDALVALTDAGVRWCMLRVPQGQGDDHDLLVDSATVGRVAAALGEAGFVEASRWQPGGHRAFFRLRPDGDWDKLDVVTEIRFGPWGDRRLPVAPDVVRRAVGSTPRPQPPDELWLLALHHLLDRDPPAPAERRDRMAALAAGVGTAPVGAVGEAAARRCDPATLEQGLRALLTPGDQARTVAAAVRAAWRPERFGVWRGRARRKWDRLPLHSARRGLTFAVLGPDGAGKTSVTNALERTFPLPTRRVYLGYPTAPSRWRGPGRTFIPKARVLVRGALSNQAHRRSGGVTALDRYGDEWAAEAAGSAKRRVGARVLRTVAATSRPDLVVILDAPAATMFARKGEHDVAELERRRSRYLALAKQLPNAVVVDAAQPLELTVRDTVDAVWSAYRQRR